MAFRSYSTAIIIPARYGSTRLPGKPLFNIAGKTLIQRVCEIATRAAQQLNGVIVAVATDDHRIVEHVQSLNNGVQVIITPKECATGSDRIFAAAQQLIEKPRYIVNLQGDAPLTPVSVVIDIIRALQNHSVVTPAKQLSWDELEQLRIAKQLHPFSGTSVTINAQNEALWFSKQIIPAIRNENILRNQSNMSPIYQHLGIYGYSMEMLEIFTKLMPGYYETLEGLEQLRLLEHGYKINILSLKLENLLAWRGVDTQADANYVAKIINGDAL